MALMKFVVYRSVDWIGGVIMTSALPPLHRSRSTCPLHRMVQVGYGPVGGRPPCWHAEASYQPALFWYGNKTAICNHKALFVFFLPLKF